MNWARSLSLGLSLLALAPSGCSGGYPLEPTLCDRICHASQGALYCDDYDPARCVGHCEAQGLSIAPCARELETVVDCFERTPSAISAQCNYGPESNLACWPQTTVLLNCVYAYRGVAPP